MIDTAQYRASIGIFLGVVRSNLKTLCRELFFWKVIFLNFLFHILVLRQLMSTHGDIESNPGPYDGDLSKSCICHVNMRSIMALGDTTQGITKFQAFETFVASNDFDVIGITETWLDNTIDNDKICLENYVMPVRRDRNRNGGGVCVYIKHNFPARRVKHLEGNALEIICIEYFTKGEKRLICVVYKPPDVDTITFLHNIDDMLSKCHEYDDVILMGDFNSKHSEFCPSDNNTADGRLLKAYFDSMEFVQMMHEPTRYPPNNGHPSCLDLVLTKCPLLINNINVHPPINNCDHCPVSIKLSKTIQTYLTYKRMVWNFKRGNYDQLRTILHNTHWDSVFVKDNIHDMTVEFMDILSHICEVCVPHYETTIRPNTKRYITTAIKKLIRQRDRAYRLYKQDTTAISRHNYTKLRNKVVSEIRISLNKLEENEIYILSHAHINDPKVYWQALKSKYKITQKPLIPPLLHNNQLISDPVIKAELFNDYFVNQTKLDDELSNLPLNHPYIHWSLSHINITGYDTYKILSQLDISKATGADNIGNRLLREAAIAICEPLSRLFQASINHGVYPDLWKLANITALHKKGDIYDRNNYRPISLLPCISKVFEKLVFTQMYSYLTTHNLINPNQSGFRPNDSTVRQLTSICHKISQSIDNGDEILSIFLDFKKAFDKVWHRGLIFKTEQIGFRGTLLKWLSSYLMNRQQRVVIQGKHSSYQYVHAGIPQGSVLGPLLFLIYINDVCSNIKSIIQLYADNTSLFRIVRNTHIIAAVNDINNKGLHNSSLRSALINLKNPFRPNQYRSCMVTLPYNM